MHTAIGTHMDTKLKDLMVTYATIPQEEKDFFFEFATRIKNANNSSDESSYAKLLVDALVSDDDGEDSFAQIITTHARDLAMECELNLNLRRFIITGLQLGISHENSLCALSFGALYYNGQIVSQNYLAARDLYELAAGLGSTQAAINLGYIYEYGRTAAPDYATAYLWYSFAAGVSHAPEALYKMGDLYARKYIPGATIQMAFSLWVSSFEEATEKNYLDDKAQAAMRLAPYYADAIKASEVDVEVDLMWALHLYHEAEIGLRVAINQGQTYYKKRLQQALDGQAQVRCIMDGSDFLSE